MVNVIETTSFLPFRQTARTVSCAVVMARTRFRHVTLHINIFLSVVVEPRSQDTACIGRPPVTAQFLSTGRSFIGFPAKEMIK